MRRAKIVCTLGPATDSAERILELAQAGMNVARINASHGAYPEHEKRIDRVRAAAKQLDHPIAVLVDLQGPKIRLETFEEGPVQLNVGDRFVITTRDVAGNKEICGTTYKGLAGDCHPGDILLIDDGKVSLRVVEVKDGTDVVTEVVVPGPVSDHKGINLPGVAVSLPAMTEKDEADLRWALHYGADLIALSFVRDASDINRAHEIMDEEGVHLPVIAKIEKPQAIEHLDAIVQAFDGIMVARGDLGVELPLEQVPVVQKMAISLARKRAKPVILATQVLESMIQNPRPTRAEASDCANAVLDGADAVMLSGETSVGLYPVECVRTMASIISFTEENGLEQIPQLSSLHRTRNGVITRAALDIGEALGVRAVVVFTETSHTARRVTRNRSRLPVICFTPREKVRNQMALLWGADTYIADTVYSTDGMVQQVEDRLTELGLAERGDRVVIVAGMPAGVAGSTNTLRVHKIGEATGVK
ncbi:pyruvate kinase [Actinobaculum suis]|uniref:Pyruvate kinase n=1 Tax=Actinobaculum suis TaxID=1657 RepID=A0A7Z9C9S7_9ACTO|nr:pyruvate kinase [Actinobaculum suis]VDG76506.1 pyruvate kinase [Actinobaculum suis]